MRGLTIALLGPGRIELDGQALTRLLAPKHQALIYLLAADKRAWPRAQLATLLWGELEESAARGNLRGALMRLRRWLPDMLAVDAHQVAFADPSGVRVDLQALLHAQQHSDAPHAGRVAAAQAWRGPLLEGFDVGAAEAFDDWLTGMRRRAGQAVLALRHDLLARAETAGQLDEAIVHAQALLDIDDADEAAHMALMRLLAATGRRTAAIAQYEACRAALAQRLGAKPSAACYALYTHIHADALPVARQAAPAAAESFAKVEAAGVQAIQRFVSAEAAASAAIAPAASAPLSSRAALPAQHLPLIGRTRELAQIAERLADPACRWLTLVGPGGVGKTRLALAAAAAHAATQRHGMLVLSGRDDANGGILRDVPSMLQAVIERAGIDRHAPGAMLLVLDNLETVPTAQRFEPLLRERAPGVTVLATSRMRVGGGREWLVELQGLSLEREQADRPASSPAAQLLEAAARRLAPGFRAADEAVAVERICALVGGLPLALEMAGRGVHTAGAAAVAERIAAGAPLADADRYDGDRHHSIEALMADAWALLDVPTQAAALRLAQLPTAFDATLAQAAGVDIDLLATLRERTWLARVDGPSDASSPPPTAGWLALHPLQQAWLRRRVDPALAAEVAAALHRALATTLPTVAPFGDLEPDTPLPLLALRAASAPSVLVEATRHAVDHEPPEALARWLDGAVALLDGCGHPAEAAALIDGVLARHDLPLVRRIGWMLRRVEMLDREGRASLAQRERRGALLAWGVPDMAAEDAGWVDVFRARIALRQLWRSLTADPVREVFGHLLVRHAVFNANALSFLPDPGPVMRAGAWAQAACRATRAPAVMRWIGLAWAGASLGHPAMARWCAARSRWPSHPPMPPRNLALLESGREAMHMITGDWDGLAARLDALTGTLERLAGGRHEMEVRSLGAKLALYEGRLLEAWNRFGRISELALQRPGESWRAWGPVGQCEAGMYLPDIDDARLQGLLERATQILSEMENFDAAYVLRRHGVAARLAWRRGDIEAAREAVRTGVAAAGRTRQFGFWAHEGLGALGDVLARLRIARYGPDAALAAAWAALVPTLEAHRRRFPPAASMCHRVHGAHAVAAGRVEDGRRLLGQAVACAERQGARLDLARALEMLEALRPPTEAEPASVRLWAEMRA